MPGGLPVRRPAKIKKFRLPAKPLI
jgi:hypothetical protein